MRRPKRPISLNLSPDFSQHGMSLGKVSVRSPYTPGPPTAIYHAPQTAIRQKSAVERQQHDKPHRQARRLSFFQHLPRELRDKIYDHLVGETVVTVNGLLEQGFRVARHGAAETRLWKRCHFLGRFRYVNACSPSENWLCISRQFFIEIRDALWRCMHLKFERRWDFVNAALSASFQLNSSQSVTNSSDLSMFPIRTNVLTHVQDLQLDLCRDSDFSGRVTTQEAMRVTTAILTTTKSQMPALKRLCLIIDQRSRVCSSTIAFLPDPWFLRALLCLSKIKLELKPGPGYRGRSRGQKHARCCIEAMNAVLGSHFRKAERYPQLDGDNFRDTQLAANFGRLMLQHTRNFPDMDEAHWALATKIVMLEAVL